MNLHLPKHVMVFDVESIGLHGEGFSVGWVITDRTEELDCSGHACNPSKAEGELRDRDWVHEHVPEPLSGYGHRYPTRVRDAFWASWLEAKAKYPGIVLAADCSWPVEANFLAACILDNPVERSLQGPYPLHEIATYLSAAGMDPLKTYDREANELPVHDPMADARQSARLLRAAFSTLEALHGPK